jgi:hypothetical protein
MVAGFTQRFVAGMPRRRSAATVAGLRRYGFRFHQSAKMTSPCPVFFSLPMGSNKSLLVM